jgi:hypothetical protein
MQTMDFMWRDICSGRQRNIEPFNTGRGTVATVDKAFGGARSDEADIR